MGKRGFYRRKKVAGHFPEYGAIFMSNRSTFKECFEKSLLGLPDSHSGFVRRVKAGMILFLFEFEERKLYGVFKAISDGGMNIVPHAYISSGRQFPAQVKFTTIWHCDPLFENEFCDAIRDNYFGTYKFNFGLSKDQIESLLWLFNSRKHKVPNSLHLNKRKEREWDILSIEGGIMKGSFTKIQIPQVKLNMNHGISVIAEPEVERLSLSPDPCRKCESIHFDDDAYDPEHPGFHHPEGSGAHSAAGHESHELLTLQQEKGNSHIFAEDTEDYIPLFSSDDSDSEQEEFDLRECSEGKQIELGMFVGNKVSSAHLLSDGSDLQTKAGSDHLKLLLSKGMHCDNPKELGMFVGSKVSSIPIPQFQLSSEGYNQMKMDHPFDSPHGSSCFWVDDSSNAAHLLSPVSDLQSKDGNDHLKLQLSKGMYSDGPKKRISVFSRLNFSSKGIASKNQNDTSGNELVNDMSRAKQHCQCEYENMEEVTQQRSGIEDCTMSKRTSVFLRLTSASDAVSPHGLKEGTGEWKKGKEKSNFSG